MEFSRAVLLACASVLGLLFYIVAALLVALAATNAARDADAPVAQTLGLAAAFAAGGFVSRRLAKFLA